MPCVDSVLQTPHFAEFKLNYDNDVTFFFIAVHLNAFLFIGFKYYWGVFEAPSVFFAQVLCCDPSNSVFLIRYQCFFCCCFFYATWI